MALLVFLNKGPVASYASTGVVLFSLVFLSILVPWSLREIRYGQMGVKTTQSTSDESGEKWKTRASEG